MKIFLRRLIHGIWYLAATAILFAAVLVSVARLASPLFNQHRADLEVWASELLQLPITISAVNVDWRGNIPELSLTHVVTLDKQTHKPSFEIQEIKIGLQLFSSLWERKIVLQDIIISGAEITILQDAAGKFSVKDLPTEGQAGYRSYELTDILAWIFSQPYLALREIDVHYFPFKGEKREFTFKKIALINTNAKHRINGSLVLHQEIPTEVKMHIDWSGNLTDPAQIKAHAYFNLEGFSLAQWLKGKNQALLSQALSGWQVNQGLGGADIWVDWDKGQLQEIQSVFQWYDLEFYSDFDKKTYPIERLSGHVGWKRDGVKQVFAGDDILVNFPNHFWPATNFYLLLTPEDAKAAAVVPARVKPSVKEATPTYTDKLDQSLALAQTSVKSTFSTENSWRLQELRIGYLDLQDVMPIVLANSILPADWRKNLTELHALGEVQNLVFAWRGKLTDLDQLSISGRVKNLSFHPWQKWPGVLNFSSGFQWNGSEGNAEVESEDFTLTLGMLFAQPLVFDEFRGHFDFQHSVNKGWSFQARNVALTNTYLKTQTSIQMVFPVKTPASIDMSTDFSLSKVTQLPSYLPSQIMSAELLAWLKAAFLSGRLEAGKALIQGKLSDFPFEPSKDAKQKEIQTGKFEVSAELKGVDFHYAPQWPLVEQANGRITFSGRSMKVLIDSAVIMDLPINQISGLIPYLGDDKPQILEVRGQLKSDLAQGLDFIHQSPLEEIIGKDLANLKIKGPMTLDLFLSVPLSKPEQIKVLGDVAVTQGVLFLPAWDMTLDQLKGSFQFSEKDLHAKQLQGKLWEEPVLLSLSTVAASKGNLPYIGVKLVGKVGVPQLQTTLHLPLGQFLAGAAAYQAQLKLYPASDANNEVTLSSDLQGIAVDLPPPFAKSVSMKRDFSLRFAIGQTTQFKTFLTYGKLVAAQLTIGMEPGFRTVDIDSSQVKGRVRVAYPFDMKKLLQAQFEKLAFAEGDSQTISSLDPRSLPPLSINAKQFIYGNKNLGQMTLNTQPSSRGLNIQNFNLSAADYSFQSRGQWTGVGSSQHSQLQGTIESPKVNRFLDRLGLSLRSLVVDKGRAAFDLQWKGPPYNFSLASASGDFSFALERGRIINLNESDNNKMDIGRMLSVFSLQTIPRRLSLDFSDLFEKGYSFDFMRGDFALKQGSAFTQKAAVFEGPVAHVGASGRIGLLAQDYDLTLSISPYVTESLPLVAGALTLNPFVGAAAWLVNKAVLSKEVSKVITYNYKVTGPWRAPVWQSMQSKKKG